MAALTNNAEGGANTVAVDAGDTGSGDTFDVVAAGSGTLTYATSAAYNGALGYAVSPGSTSDRCQLRWEPASTSRLNVARFYFKFTSAFPATGMALFSYSNTAQSSTYMALLVNSTGGMVVQNNVGASVGSATADGWGNGGSTSTGAISTSTWYRCEASIDNTGGTSSGDVVLQIFPQDSLSPVSGLSFSTVGMTDAALTFGAVAIGAMNFGRVSPGTTTPTLVYDDLAVTTATTTFIGPSVPSAPPQQPHVYPNLAATQTASW